MIFSLALVGATLFIPTRLENKAEIQRVKLGYPAYFMEQNFYNKYGGQYFFPTWEKVDWSGKYPVVSFSPAGLVIDFGLIFLACECLVYILETVDFAIRKEK